MLSTPHTSLQSTDPQPPTHPRVALCKDSHSRTWLRHLGNLRVLNGGHVTQDAEDEETREEARTAVSEREDDGVSTYGKRSKI